VPPRPCLRKLGLDPRRGPGLLVHCPTRPSTRRVVVCSTVALPPAGPSPVSPPRPRALVVPPIRGPLSLSPPLPNIGAAPQNHNRTADDTRRPFAPLLPRPPPPSPPPSPVTGSLASPAPCETPRAPRPPAHRCAPRPWGPGRPGVGVTPAESVSRPALGTPSPAGPWENPPLLGRPGPTRLGPPAQRENVFFFFLFDPRKRDPVSLAPPPAFRPRGPLALGYPVGPTSRPAASPAPSPPGSNGGAGPKKNKPGPGPEAN